MVDLRPQHDEEVVAANHPTKTDVTNRAWNVEHETDGTHKTSIFGTGLTGGAGTAVSVDGIVEAGSIELKIKVITIGDWNMDADANKTVAHGLTLADIRQIYVLIRNDNNDSYYPSDYGNDNNASFYADSDEILMNRLIGGIFDGINFNSTSYNRGWITIWYVA